MKPVGIKNTEPTVLDIARDSKEQIITAIEENLFGFIRFFCRHKQNEYHEDDRALRYISEFGSPSMLSNCVYRVRLEEDDARVKSEIAALLDEFKRRRVPVLWTVGPSDHPKGISMLLRAGGLMHVQNERGMAVRLDGLPETTPVKGLIISTVESNKRLAEFLKMYVIGFELAGSLAAAMLERYGPRFLDGAAPLRHYIGYMNGKPAGTASVYMGEGVAGIYNIITLPESRRHGIARALTLHALKHGAQCGMKTGILQATDMGAIVYRGLGFREFCKFELFCGMYGLSAITVPAVFLWRKISNALRPFVL